MEVDDNGDVDGDEERRRNGKDGEGEDGRGRGVMQGLIAATPKGLGGTAKRANIRKQTISRIGN
ncbi:hypothetical protein TWF173_001238 [Orbilia oligospora]|nr:hypothetical protein TWF173_001238 [Orbilia oligospora]